MLTESQFEVDFLHRCCAFTNNIQGRYLGCVAPLDDVPISSSELGPTTAQDDLRTPPDEIALGELSGSR